MTGSLRGDEVLTTIIECDGPCERRIRHDEPALGWLSLGRLSDFRADGRRPWHFCGGECLSVWVRTEKL